MVTDIGKKLMQIIAPTNSADTVAVGTPVGIPFTGLDREPATPKPEPLSERAKAELTPKIIRRQPTLEEQLSHVPSPPPSALPLIFRAAGCTADEALISALIADDAEWMAAQNVVNSHTHDRAREAFAEHQAELAGAAGDGPAIREIQVRTKEDFEADYRAKMSVAKVHLKTVAERAFERVRPSLKAFSEKILAFADGEATPEKVRYQAVGLPFPGPSPFVQSLQKAAVELAAMDDVWHRHVRPAVWVQILTGSPHAPE